MRAPALVGIVTALHIIGITALVSIQGCGTTRTARVSPMAVEQPPPPTMPPKASLPAMESPVFSRPPAATTSSAGSLEGTSYTIKSGDTLSQVATRHGVGSRDLAEYNGITNPNVLKVGQTLIIPPYAKGTSSGSSSLPAPRTDASAPAVAGSGVYVVLAGDNLSKIAKRNGTSVAALKQVNNLTSDRINVGDKLALPSGIGSVQSTGSSVSSMSSAPTARPATTPMPRTAPMSVTEEVDVTSLDLNTGGIVPINVPSSRGSSSLGAASSVSIPAIQDKPILYTVVDGDSVDEIAKLFIVSKGEILKLNNLAPGAALTPGQTIRIPPSAL